jgi:hypothetical protein
VQAATSRDPLLTPATRAELREKLGLSRREGVGVRGGSTNVSAGDILWPSRKLAAAAMVNTGGAAAACTSRRIRRDNDAPQQRIDPARNPHIAVIEQARPVK